MCQQQAPGFDAAVMMSALVAQSLAAGDFCPSASSPRTALPCVVSPAAGPAALATLQSLLGIKTWALHEVCRIWSVLKQEWLLLYECVHFYNIPEYHRRPGSSALQKNYYFRSEFWPFSHVRWWPVTQEGRAGNQSHCHWSTSFLGVNRNGKK